MLSRSIFKLPVTARSPVTILITCETSGTDVPEMLFACGDTRLSPAGQIDVCGGEVADRLAELLNAPCLKHRYRHELVDVTRSIRHRKLFGDSIRGWSRERKQDLVDIAYHPYRFRVESAIERILQQFTFAIHLSVRTFDLREGGKLRRTDAGLLYDPSRGDELDLCLDWIDELYDAYPNLRVRRNYPRRGTVDSLTKAMRGRFPADQYLGIEVWMNRAWAARKVRLREEALVQFADALKVTIGVSNLEAA